MSVTERAVSFDCQGEQLLGILAEPAQPSGVGVVVIVGGPQYRVGSHRQFTLLSRALAAQGHHCLRFDYRGMGDSEGPLRSFEDVGKDIAAAVRSLREQCPAVRQVVLWGLCDGASAALLYVDGQAADGDIAGLVLLNPWVRSTESLAKTQVKHYYAQRLMQKEFWLKLLSGRTGLKALKEFLAKLRTASRAKPASADRLGFQARMARAWKRFPGPVLLLLSGTDYVAKEFLDHVKASREWQGLIDRPTTTRRDFAEADHTFSSAPWRAEVEQATNHWLATALRPSASTQAELMR
ncbi:hydrolase 1, exosortase A system-associated [Pelomonas sp. SE-A7]|uniref:hydrolase 1, exosortase A system-associated n=1 Tax=Pelomonas sp. SE-A7 TaxID=3054953 RepID=UPI00259C6ED9|nr:hydrolase 1, exosortase A system-associated [Pelomonas sp. SE-A7]MDM4764897.1 hydrolase 1, exosortase A system-associated [Pelomonas sp. SE-A7]